MTTAQVDSVVWNRLNGHGEAGGEAARARAGRVHVCDVRALASHSSPHQTIPCLLVGR